MVQRSPAAHELTEGQRRHLTASLLQVEQAMRRITELTQASLPGDSRLLARKGGEPSAGLSDALRGPLDGVAATLAELVGTFGLAPFPTSHLRTVRALIVSSLVIIEDTVSAKLRGYGPLHPGLPVRLDPLLARLHEQLVEMDRRLPRSDPGAESSV